MSPNRIDFIPLVLSKLITNIIVYTNLMVQLSYIHGHEIHVVSYTCLDGDY